MSGLALDCPFIVAEGDLALLDQLGHFPPPGATPVETEDIR